MVADAAGDRDAPYTLAYVDLDDGPRLLVHLTERAAIGARVRLAEPSTSTIAPIWGTPEALRT